MVRGMTYARALERADELLADVVGKTRVWGDELEALRQGIARALMEAGEKRWQ